MSGSQYSIFIDNITQIFQRMLIDIVTKFIGKRIWGLSNMTYLTAIRMCE